MTALTSDRGRLLAAGLEARPPAGGQAPPEAWITPVLWQSVTGQRWSPAVPAPAASGSWTAAVARVFGVVRSVVRDGDVLWAAGSIASCACGDAERGPSRAIIWGSRDGGQHWSALPDPDGLFDGICHRDCRTGAEINAMAVHDGVVVAVGDDNQGAVWRGTAT